MELSHGMRLWTMQMVGAETWQMRLQSFLLPRGDASLNEDAVLLEDTQMDAADAAEDASAQLVVAMQRQAMAQQRSRKEAVKQQARACAEQAWDDWAMHVELRVTKVEHEHAKAASLSKMRFVMLEHKRGS